MSTADERNREYPPEGGERRRYPARRADDKVGVVELVGKMDDLRRELETHRAALVEADNRSRRGQNVAIVASTIAVLAIAVGAGALVDAAGNRNALHVEASSKTEARHAACVQDNIQTARERIADVAGLREGLRTANVSDGDARPIVKAYQDTVDADLPYRVCTRAAIDAYYAHPPTDPGSTP